MEKSRDQGDEKKRVKNELFSTEKWKKMNPLIVFYLRDDKFN